jgi:hypothetical protein
MIHRYIIRSFVNRLVILAALFNPILGMACNVCRGNPNAALTAGMDMAILTLLGFIGFVLCAFVSFFLYLRKKAASYHLNNDNYSS